MAFGGADFFSSLLLFWVIIIMILDVCLCSEFSRAALSDIDRFQQQKVSDLRETLAAYVVLQIKMCRKVLLLLASLSGISCKMLFQLLWALWNVCALCLAITLREVFSNELRVECLVEELLCKCSAKNIFSSSCNSWTFSNIWSRQPTMIAQHPIANDLLCQLW